MRKFLLLAAGFILMASGLRSQGTYGHEWIDFSSPYPYLRIKVAEIGLHRIDYNTLNAALASAGYSLASIDPRDFMLFHNGEQQYIYIKGEDDGKFDGSDFLEFFGEKNDGWLDGELYATGQHRPNPYYSLINDTSAYYLTWNPSSLVFKKRVNVVSNDLTSPPPAEPYYMHEELLEMHGKFQTGYKTLVQGVYLLDSRYQEGEGFTDNDFNKTTKTYNLQLPYIYNSGPVSTASVDMRVVSIYSQVHELKFEVNGTQYAQLTINGQKVKDVLFDVPLTQLNNGSGTDAFSVTSYGSGSSDRNAVGFIRVRYPRYFNFGNATSWHFRIAGTPAAERYLEISNFNAENTTPVLYDLTNHQRIAGVVTGGILKFNIPVHSADTLDLFVSNQASAIYPVSSLEEVHFVDYSDVSNQGDYIIITHPSLRSGPTDWVEAYRQHRASAAGGGYNAIIVDVNLLYDQFAYGIAKHPLALMHFIQYARDSFQTGIKHIFLLGNGYEYYACRTNTVNYSRSLIPTFGHPGSDELLVTDGLDVTPFASIGRLAAQNPDHVRIYYNKVLALETNQNDPLQTIENKEWMKNVLHFGGGSNAGQQGLFRSFLNNYAKIIEDTLFGGHVTSFFKTSPDPIQYLASQYLDSIINHGVSLITFFGHSSTGSFDVNLDRPENYDNYGKYPVMVSNGCFAGLIYGGGGSASEEFVLTEDRGAIAFLSSSYYAEVSSLNVYSDVLYRFISQRYYGEGIGTILYRTKQYITDSLNSNIFIDFLAEQNTLHGDPAVRLNPFPKPDYAIETKYIKFDPPVVTADLDSFKVKVIIHNIGRAIDTAFNVDIYRILPDQSQDFQSKRVKATRYRDTIVFTFFTDPVNGIGQNRFEVYIDPGNEIPEITTINNFATNDLFINSDDAFPVYPYEFAILNQPPAYLKASTANAFTGNQAYLFELDTTEAFNSPLKSTFSVVQQGGVVEWNNPAMTWLDSTVYYWRISPVPDTGNTYKWHSSSFIYLSNSSEGWNQSHYFQYLKDNFNNIVLPSDRQFRFISDIKELKVVNGIYPWIDWSIIMYYINGSQTDRWGCQGSGLNIAVFDSVSGLPWYTGDYNFGETECGYKNMKYAFHFKTSTQTQRQNVINFLNNGIPNGNHILMYSFNNPHYELWRADTAALGTSLFEAIAALGGGALDYVDTLGYPVPFVFFCKKGDLSTAQMVIGDTVNSLIDTTFSFQGLWDNGFVNSTLIGPAEDWQNLDWLQHPSDGKLTDSVSLDVYGVDYSGSKTLLLQGITTASTPLNSIDPTLYPYLQLRWNVEDDSLRTAAQLDYWRVHYQPAPEAAVNPLLGYSINKDTLDQGDKLKISVKIQNISPYDMDSLLVRYALVDHNNVKTTLADIRYDSLRAGEVMDASFTLNTLGYPGLNLFILEANPDYDQPEQYHFNNFAIFPFYVSRDRYNPLLDVTFDGVHIMDGDIVSAKPEIVIRLKDENRYLAMDDTSLINVWFKYPDGFKKALNFQTDNAEFYPADTSKLAQDNSAMIVIHPKFTQDGTYQLIVTGRDKTGNESGDIQYQVGFEVINQAMISNVLNYPNPFTTGTRFVFTLTGAELPDYLKIQIMTVSGKIVREIGMDELGPVHIGRNITEFVWDGTDQYGDPLANGTYLYRVIAVKNGQTVDHYSNTSIDKYFKQGFGKMYLMR